MKIELIVDELVLHGFDPRHRHAIGDAVRAELTALVRAHAAELQTRRPMDVVHLDAGAFTASRAVPGRLGTGIAKGVFGALQGSRP